MTFEKEKAAHATGKRIQFRDPKDSCPEWEHVGFPAWIFEYEYRIHPDDVDEETPVTTPHKHAALIKAWADGAQIQVLSHLTLWRDVELPDWNTESQYRVKPSNVVRFVPVLRNPRGGMSLSQGVTTKECASLQADKYHTLPGILRIEINPDTLELVSATMERP